MADSEKVPAMGFLYGAMDRAKEQIKVALDNNIASYSEIVKIIDTKWEDQMNRPLHAAACLLNPAFQYDENWRVDVKVKLGLYKALDRMITDMEAREKAELQLADFIHRREMFGNPIALSTAKKRAPAEWWEAYGDHCPELQAFAVRVLSLTCSSSACERNWSTFNQIHTKRRNRLSVEKMNFLAYVMYNRKLRERHLKKISLKEDEEPLLLDRCPSDDEWVAGLEDTRPSRASMGSEEPSQEASQPAPRTYSRKRKTTVTSSSSRGKGILGIIDEESNEPKLSDGESEEDVGDDDATIPYAETSGSDDDDDDGGGGGGDDIGHGSFDPNFRLPSSDNSMFAF